MPGPRVTTYRGFCPLLLIGLFSLRLRFCPSTSDFVRLSVYKCICYIRERGGNLERHFTSNIGDLIPKMNYKCNQKWCAPRVVSININHEIFMSTWLISIGRRRHLYGALKKRLARRQVLCNCVCCYPVIPATKPTMHFALWKVFFTR